MPLIPIIKYAHAYFKDKYEPNAAINHAYTWARETGEAKYVTYSKDGTHWVAVAERPSVKVSHWMVNEKGHTFAHVAERGLDNYFYEALPDD